MIGSLDRPTYRAKDGTLKESAVIWLKCRDALGVLRRESSETEKEQEAKRILKQTRGRRRRGARDRAEGRPRRAIQLTSTDVTKYRVQRLEAAAVPAIVNRELAALKRMFSLAVKGERLKKRDLHRARSVACALRCG